VSGALAANILSAALANPDALKTFVELVADIAKLRTVDPVGFFHGLFDPAKAETNAAAIVSAGLDALIVEGRVEFLKLAATTAEAERVGATIESPPYDR
jgi:hypothetical protein